MTNECLTNTESMCFGQFFLGWYIYVLWVYLWRILLDELRQGCYKGKCSMGVLVRLYISRLGEAAHPSKWQKYIKVLTQLNLICHWTVGSLELKKPGTGILVTSFLAFFHFGLCLCFTQCNNREKNVLGSWNKCLALQDPGVNISCTCGLIFEFQQPLRQALHSVQKDHYSILAIG